MVCGGQKWRTSTRMCLASKSTLRITSCDVCYTSVKNCQVVNQKCNENTLIRVPHFEIKKIIPFFLEVLYSFLTFFKTIFRIFYFCVWNYIFSFEYNGLLT